MKRDEAKTDRLMDALLKEVGIDGADVEGFSEAIAGTIEGKSSTPAAQKPNRPAKKGPPPAARKQGKPPAKGSAA